MKSDGTVVAWGNNDFGQTDVPAGLTGVIAISAGSFHNLALKGDGAVVAWGGNFQGQTDVPVGLEGVSEVAAGVQHSLALKSDGTAVAWGYNGFGQTDVPAGLQGVTEIVAGGSHSLALVAAQDNQDNLRLNIFWGPKDARTLAYHNTAKLTSGDYLVNPATGALTAISGIGTIPSAVSGDATVVFDISFNDATKKWSGNVIVNDSGAGFSATVPIHSWRFGVTRDQTTTRGVLWGFKALSVPQKCFMFVFENRRSGLTPVIDLSKAPDPGCCITLA